MNKANSPSPFTDTARDLRLLAWMIPLATAANVLGTDFPAIHRWLAAWLGGHMADHVATGSILLSIVLPLATAILTRRFAALTGFLVVFLSILVSVIDIAIEEPKSEQRADVFEFALFWLGVYAVEVVPIVMIRQRKRLNVLDAQKREAAIERMITTQQDGVWPPAPQIVEAEPKVNQL